jgi:hypothetical protein
MERYKEKAQSLYPDHEIVCILTGYHLYEETIARAKEDNYKILQRGLRNYKALDL